MKNLFYVFLLLVGIGCASTPKQNISTPQSYIFPEDWLGTYEGELEMWNAEKGLLQTFKMRLNIAETDTTGRYLWYSKIDFNGKEIIKNYNWFF